MSILTGYAIPTGFLGTDHTYVKSDNPAFTWPCWGRRAGGKEICRGSGNASTANCISQPNSWAGIIYGVTGVCHQTANRILFPAGKTVSKAGGYWASVLAYGVYGSPASMAEWLARLAICGIVSGKSLSKSLEIDTANKASSPEDRERAYLQKVVGIYSELDQSPKKFSTMIIEDKGSSLSGKELKLMMEFRLGRSLDVEITSPTLKHQVDFLKRKHEMDHDLYGANLSIEKYVQEGNEIFGELLRQFAEVLGKEQFEKIFGLAPPDGSFMLIDPDIATKVHSRK